MSLFASAFESGITAGPSTAYHAAQSGKNSHKRKRPSGAGDSKGNDDQLHSAQKNLERLMKNLDDGPSVKKANKKEGREGMGVMPPKKKNKGRAERLQAKEKALGVPLNKQLHPKSEQKERSGAERLMDGRETVQTTPRGKKEKKQKPHAVEIPLPPSPAVKEEDTAGLTSMQKGMRSKLEGARFRWINEQLYSTPSTEAVAMMKKDPKIFADYHQAHRTQTAAWPQPPLPYIIERIAPLPRGTIVVDLGCGDAGLARALVPKGKVVLSYDLVGDNGVADAETDGKNEGWVVQADFLTNIPLPGRPGGEDAEEEEKPRKKKGKGKEAGSEIVDVAVCCLSLMGTNWVGGIYEACRVLKQGGTFHVAEVTSRFTSTEAFVEKVESFGFKLDEEESPSTHFTLFTFTKTTSVPLAPVRGQQGWEARVKEGEEILQACVYKKR